MSAVRPPAVGIDSIRRGICEAGGGGTAKNEVKMVCKLLAIQIPATWVPRLGRLLGPQIKVDYGDGEVPRAGGLLE
jgi:hypothetical protein